MEKKAAKKSPKRVKSLLQQHKWLRDNKFFIVTSLLLIVFQAGVYIKTCKWPDFIQLNMILLYIALLFPFIFERIKNKRIAGALLILYLVYFTIVAVGFTQSIINASVNCEGLIHMDLSDYLALTNNSLAIS
ncbi:hypothetical protein GOV09_02060 [Candidatus Woesearchaeota archaeon]|nr:hypothetical protein [Candidatus Woesearchaeota archaeon]